MIFIKICVVVILFKNKFVIINFKYIFFIIIVNKMNKIFLLKRVIYLIILYYFKNLEII